LFGWKHLEVPLNAPAVDGNIARQFDSGGSQAPPRFRELLGRGNEQNSAALYSREGFANCIDAAPGKDFHLKVKFDRLAGKDAEALWGLLDLATLAERATSDSVSREELGLQPEDILSAGPGTPIRTMTSVEVGGGGMPGAISEHGSVMANALFKVGFTNNEAGALGSYGYGKAAVAQASSIRVLVAYSCFEARGGDPITRRLMGVTYWGQHSYEGRSYLGFAGFGDIRSDQPASEFPLPLEDEAADQFAESLGLTRRNADVPEERGTTFLLLEPSFEADDLRRATELFWWPRLQNDREGTFGVEITDEGGAVHFPSVDSDHPQLGPFVKAYRASGRAGLNSDSDSREMVTEDAAVRFGEAGITSLRVCSTPEHISLLAVMREPRMVVSYENVRLESHNPALAGVFVAHDHNNEHLRRVEPHEHDKWFLVNAGALKATRDDFDVSRQVRADVKAAEMLLRAPDPEPVTSAAVFSRFFPAANTATTKPRPPKPRGEKKQRLVRVWLVHPDDGSRIVERPTRLPVADNSAWLAQAQVHFSLDEARAKRLSLQNLEAEIKIRAVVLESDIDSRVGTDWPISVKQLPGGHEPFQEASSSADKVKRYRGVFEIGHPVQFEVQTDPYELDWAIKLVFDCDPWDMAEKQVMLSDTEEAS
jgi:hypothetical protein